MMKLLAIIAMITAMVICTACFITRSMCETVAITMVTSEDLKEHKKHMCMQVYYTFMAIFSSMMTTLGICVLYVEYIW